MMVTPFDALMFGFIGAVVLGVVVFVIDSILRWAEGWW